MKIEIRELGYVKSLDLNLDKDLTILCGPNNTGKTYVAYAVYGLMRFRSQLPRSKKISNQLSEIFDKGKIEINIIDLLTEKSSFLQTVGKNYLKQLPRVFASDESTFSKTDIKLEYGDLEKLTKKILGEEVGQEIGVRNSVLVRISKEKDSPIVSCILLENESKNQKIEIPRPILLDFISERISDIFVDFLFPKTFIAPAERSAINIFSKELSLKRNVLVDKLLDLKEDNKDEDPFDLVNRRATRYPAPIRDSLEISEDLNNFKKNVGEFKYFADEIEKEILKGQVLISKDGEVQFKPEKAKSLKLPIHLTASVVKSLSNLVIYFRHLAKPGDFIIIDEPELNLHPDNQVIIARIIAKIVNNGFKVLISTHSDYVVRELNNLIMLGNRTQPDDKYEHLKDYFLDHNRIGALLFHYNARKTLNLEVNNTGFEVSTIDSIINELNERSEDLFFNVEVNG